MKKRAEKNPKSISSPRKLGRPTKLSPAITDEICHRLAEGESLLSICRDDHMPIAQSVRSWLINDADFFFRYSRAREAQADTIADQVLDISDSVFATAEEVAKAKLQVSARQWYLSKVAAKKYGDRLDLRAKLDLTASALFARAKGDSDEDDTQ